MGGMRTCLLCSSAWATRSRRLNAHSEERGVNLVSDVGNRCYFGSSRTFGPVTPIGTPFASVPLQSVRAVCSMLFGLHQRVCGVIVCDPPGWITMPRLLASPVL